MRFLLLILLPVSFATLFSGCVPLLIGTGATTGGYFVARDKKIGDTIKDAKIEAAIKSKLYKISPQLYSDASVVSECGCVLLSGLVHKSDWINLAEKESWATDGVVVVDNCLVFGKEISASQMISDSFITSTSRASIICESAIKSVNYKIKTMNGVVYLMGRARTAAELKLALSKIQSVKGVKKIVSYVSVQKIRN
jgi:osmotically-inducible protein OsmY